ncbi:RagB/SusD family nutrient uptake outer membrane protein [Marinifilum caeruleilacunae]|uniref:RagB/SusD family nutrient uptake outer membrane protein n=1 Tax=Marinifilum caeruleilacunae TaxID=2499076 RepID=A0ABX1X176_9BACT|nr:RagB/SusD family nutrient uptake outer membrane protein [Marinifilum caeruleilacunae]NOU61835.1 RagB/SusD family nutrient uptake outer membrane protein [Marinifilum caeruleilacunae]
MKVYIKSISKVLLVLASGLLLTNCSDDFLDQDKLGEETSDVYFNSQEKAVASLTAAYSDLKDYRFGWFFWAFGETLSDNAVYSGSDGDNAGFEPLKTFNGTADAFQVRLKWQLCYRGINKSSQTIEGTEAMDDELFESGMKARIIAEAKVLRAFYHFELVRAYGRIPVLDHLIRTADEKIGQSEIDDVYTFIISELEAAEPNLPVKSSYAASDLGRITKGFAQGLLAKVNLYAENYDAAKTWAKKVMDSNEYELDPDFAHIFSFDGENGIESVFEIDFIESDTETSAFRNNGNFQTLFQLPRNITYGYGINQPTQELADAFDAAGDIIRKEATLLTTDEVYANEIPQEVWDWYNVQTDMTVANDSLDQWKATLTFNRTGYYQEKIYVAPENRAASIRNNANNTRVMRYAEVLLMYAEACAQTSDDENARVALNEVRSRAGLSDVTASGSALIDAIYAERRLELAGENDRYHDLVRTNRANILPYWTEAKKYWPVPQAEIDNTTGEIIQNPGY